MEESVVELWADLAEAVAVALKNATEKKKMLNCCDFPLVEVPLERLVEVGDSVVPLQAVSQLRVELEAPLLLHATNAVLTLAVL